MRDLRYIQMQAEKGLLTDAIKEYQSIDSALLKALSILLNA